MREDGPMARFVVQATAFSQKNLPSNTVVSKYRYTLSSRERVRFLVAATPTQCQNFCYSI